jgi:hypothetical protein
VRAPGMTAAEVLEAGWPVVVKVYEEECRLYRCNAYVRDLMWDAAVDVLFSVARRFCGEGRTGPYLASYLKWSCRRNWWRLVFRRKPLERLMGPWGRDERGRPIDVPCRDAGQDAVDGADLMRLLDRVPEAQRAALAANLAGETWTEMAERAGTYHRLEFERGKAAVRKLRDLVGEGVTCDGH